jgi:hypothetical protein
VQVLEQRVDALELLPARMTALESQVLLLRDEMRREFTAIRNELREGDAETRRYMRVLHEEVLSRLATIQEGRRGRKRPH